MLVILLVDLLVVLLVGFWLLFVGVVFLMFCFGVFWCGLLGFLCDFIVG